MSTRNALPALTSLRFFAAALIVIQHSAGYFNIGVGLTESFTLIHGVSFFFVLSGFILAYAHYNLSGAGNIARFVWARTARVWPAHIFTMLSLYLLWVYAFNTGYAPTLHQTVLNLFLLQAWDPLPSTYFAFNGVAWTLSVEMFFYVMFPVVLFSVKKNQFVTIAASILLVVLAIAICRITGAPTSTTEDIPSTASWTYIWPPARLFEFTIGVVAGCSFVKHRQWLESLKGQTLLGVLAIGVIIGGSMFTTMAGWKLESWGLADSALRGWVVISGAAPFFAAGLVLMAANRGFIAKILSLKILVLLGEISFSIYLVHQIIIRSMMIKSNMLSGFDPVIQMVFYWVATIAVSYFLWVVIERPCQKAMNSIFKRPKPLSACLAK